MLALLEVILVFGAFGLMGEIGKSLFIFNFKIFGIFAYIYPLVLMYLSYLYLKHKKLDGHYLKICFGYVFLFLILLILQASSLAFGIIGEAIVDFLHPHLGSFGIWILCIFWIFVCLLCLSDKDIFELGKKIDFSKIYPLMKVILMRFKCFISSKQITEKLKKIFKNRLTPRPLITESPSIELQNSSPIPFLENKAPEHQKKMEDFVIQDETIAIQEFIIAPEKNDKKPTIRIVDEIDPPKENPFLQSDFPKKAQGISTSAELLKKIKNQNPEKKPQENPQEKSPKNNSSFQHLTNTQKMAFETKTPPKNLQDQGFHAPSNLSNPPSQISKNTPSSSTADPFIDPFIDPLEKSLISQSFDPSFNSSSLDPFMQEQEMPEEKTFKEEIPKKETKEEKLRALQESWQKENLQKENSKEESLKEEIPQETLEEKTPKTQQIDLMGQKSEKQIQKGQIEEKQIERRQIQEKQTEEQPPLISSSPQKIKHIKSLEENEALLKEIDQGEIIPPKDYKLPPIALLSPAPKYENEIDENEIDSKIQSLLAKLSVFKIDGDVIRTYSGPIITTFEFRPAPNVKVSRIQSLESDIAMALEAKSIRIQAPIPGKNVVGIEIPNSSTQTIYLREIFESEIFQNSTSPLTLALGKDVVGNPFITDLKKLPHLLIAGTTGSGKSVGVNAMILSLLYRNSPDDLKLMMVDPKMVEFMPYSDLPHLITPIITDPKKAVIGLSNAVREMERRYMLMSQSRTKEIVSYNQKTEESGLEKFPYFVIIIDELADLMMTAGKEVEYSMARIAQMGRASGMHLIVATQSPRAEVLTGLIKTNLPAHLSYKVGTKIDAGIIGCAGAESLLGRGDMLFTPPGVSGLVRLHAPWSSEEEISEIISYIKSQREVEYDASFLPEEKEVFGAMDCENLDEETALLLSQAKQIILQDGKTSISYLQRRLSIGYNKAADLIEKLEQLGFLSEADSKGNRKIL